MSQRLRMLWAALAAVALLAGACSNSDDDAGSDDDTDVAADDDTTPTDDDTPDDGDDAPADDDDDAEDDDTDDTGDDEIDRTTFVPLEGVPGVSDDEIAVGVIGLRSLNPLGTCILDCYVTGIQAYFDYQNSLGGVFGRDLVIEEVLDDELFGNQAKALELIANEDSFAAFGATLQPGGYGDLHDEGVPTFVWGIQAPELEGRDSLFGHIATSCVTCTARAVPWMVQQAGATKVATLGYSVSPESQTCANTVGAAIEEYSADIGAELFEVYDDLEFGLPNGIGPQVTDMIQNGVDFVASCLDLNAMEKLAREFVRQDYRDQVTLQHPNSYDAGFQAAAGDLFNGDFVVPQFLPFEWTDDAEIQIFNEWVDAQGTDDIAEQTMIGWINADLFVDGLLATGPDFSREELLTTINTTFTAHDANGLINPIDWTRQHDAPTPDDRVTNGFVQECFTPLQMQDGVFMTITDEPWLCWSTSDPAWSEPTPVDFAG